MRPLLVGELNPYGADPAMALFPLPKNSAGGRLQQLVTGFSRSEHLRRFDRANLCRGRWSMRAARDAAEELADHHPGAVFVLLGRKVADAYCVPFEPFTTQRCCAFHPWTIDCVVLPHPSGLCRLWNEPGAFERARAALREAGVLA